MPSISTAQQSLFGQAYAVKSGKLKPSDIDPRYRKMVMNRVKAMSLKSLKDFASTKHKGLKHHINDVDESSPVIGNLSSVMEPVHSEVIPVFNPQGPGLITPFLDPDSKKKNKGKKNLENLKDYRDWIDQK